MFCVCAEDKGFRGVDIICQDDEIPSLFDTFEEDEIETEEDSKKDEMEENVNEKEKCYFREEKCLNQIQKSTAIASKASLLVALRRWKNKAQSSYRVKGYSNQYRLFLHIKKAFNAVKEREDCSNFFVKVRVAQYRTETSPLEARCLLNAPSWDEKFDFYLDSVDYQLELKIVERDKFGDHFIGKCSADLTEFEPSKPCSVTKPLEDKRGIATKLNGSLEFEIVVERATSQDELEFSNSKVHDVEPIFDKANTPSDDSEYSTYSPYDIVDCPDVSEPQDARNRELSASSGYSTSSINEPPTVVPVTLANAIQNYRKLSLTPNLPRLNDPLSASKRKAKLSYSEDSDLVEGSSDFLTSDRNLSVPNVPSLLTDLPNCNSSVEDITISVPTIYSKVCEDYNHKVCEDYNHKESENKMALNKIAAKLNASKRMSVSTAAIVTNEPTITRHPGDDVSGCREDETPVKQSTNRAVEAVPRRRRLTKSSSAMELVVPKQSVCNNKDNIPSKSIVLRKKSLMVTTPQSSDSPCNNNITTDQASLSKDNLEVLNEYTGNKKLSPTSSTCSDPLHIKPPLSHSKHFKSSPSLIRQSPNMQRKSESPVLATPVLQRCENIPEHTEETDEGPKQSDKRKIFASRSGSKKKLSNREQFLLSPNALTEIGERSDNSDQSFDCGDSLTRSNTQECPSIDEMSSSVEKDDTSSEIYILRLTVESATELPVCDCYVKVKVGSIHKKTPVVEQSGSPTWNYSVEFFVNNTELKATLQVADKDPFKQEILGQATLDMTSLPLDTEKSHKLRLRGPTGGKLNSAMIVTTLIEKTDRKTATNLMKKRANTFSKKDLRRFSFKAKDSITTLKQKSKKPLATLKKSSSFFKSPAAMSNRCDLDSIETEASPTPSKHAPKYRLLIKFHEAGRLTGRNSKQTFDTYCKLRVGDIEYKTNMIRKEACPKFNESFDFDLLDISEPLRIKVFQVNRLFDEVLGNAKLKLSELPFDTDLNINEYPLMTDEARFKCWNPYISLGIKLSCLASKLSEDEIQLSTASPESMDKAMTPSPPPLLYRVIVNMFRGRALLAKDESGLSDPYVILRIGEDQQATGVIYHSLAPMWNESFLFTINDLELNLQLTVADKDPEFDDFIGHYKVKLNQVPLNQRCEFDVELSDESGRLEFSILVQHEEDIQINFIPYRSYSATPVAQLFIKPIGLAQSEKNSTRQSYRLEMQIGQETFSIFYEGPGCGTWGAIDIYDEYLEMVKFNLYLIRYGLQEELMSVLEVDMSMHGSTSTNHETMDMPSIRNMFLFCFNIKYKSYNTGVFLSRPDYDEEKSCEEMTFDELGDALTCPYNYALCIDSLVFESNGVFGDDELIAVIETERIMLKTDATKITDNELHCGFIYRMETMPRLLSLKLFKQHKNFCVFIGNTEFSITKDTDGVLKSRMSLDNDGSILHIALFYDVIQHIHQELINAVTMPKIPVLNPDADEITLLNNFKKLTYCFVTLSIFIKHMSSFRRMGSWKKLVLYILSIMMVLYIPPEYTEFTIPGVTSIFIVIISFRIIWKRKELSDMRLRVLEEISTCNVEEKIFVRTCDNAVNRINLTLQRFIYILSWNSPVQSMTSLIKLMTVATIAAILPSQLLFLIILAIIISHRTMFEGSVTEIIDFLNPLNGVPSNICS